MNTENGTRCSASRRWLGERVRMKAFACRIRLFLFLHLIGLGLFQPIAGAVELTASVDRNILYLDESFNLVLTVEDDSTNIPTPNLEPLLQDFEILNQSTQTNINITNNTPHISQSWMIELQPKRLGEIEVPSLTVAGQSTAPIQLLVQEFTGNVATEGEEIFLEVDVSTHNPYVQSQMNFTTRLFYSIPITQGTLSEPNVPFATQEGSPQEKRYRARRAGIDYRVIERRYAIFPDQSGSFTIAPIEFTSVIERTHPDTNLRNHFRERYSSNPVDIEVRPIPQTFSGSTWLPAHELRLLDSWGGRIPALKSGTPESREISIDAVGLRAEQLPLVHFEENDTVRIYGSRSSDVKSSQTYDQVISQRSDEFAIIPQHGSTVEIPKFEVIWWDIDEDREKVARLPAISAPIEPSVNRGSAGDAVGETHSAVNVLSDLAVVSSIGDQYWKLLSLALFGVWVLTLFLWYLSRRFRRNPTGPADRIQEQKVESERRSFRKVRQACENGGMADINRELLDWASIYWPDRPPRNLFELGRRLGDGGLLNLLEKLDRANYAEDETASDGRVLWQAFIRAVTSQPQPEKKKRRLLWFTRSEEPLTDLWPEHISS